MSTLAISLGITPWQPPPGSARMVFQDDTDRPDVRAASKASILREASERREAAILEVLSSRRTTVQVALATGMPVASAACTLGIMAKRNKVSKLLFKGDRSVYWEKV